MQILIVEGNPPELALAAKRGAGATYARAFAAALREAGWTSDIAYAEPLFSDHDPDAIDLGAVAGVAFTHADVRYPATDEQARPFRALCERALAIGAPVFGAGWGMEVGLAALGGATAEGEGAPEAPFARAVRPADHPMTKGRRASFDAISFSDGRATTPPPGAAVTAMNDQNAVQAIAWAEGGAAFWGVRYQPDCTLGQAAHRLGRRGGAAERGSVAHDLRLIGQDPIGYARLAAKRRVGLDILDRSYHLTELSNWLALIRGRRA